MPVKNAEREGEHTEEVENALVYRMPPTASLSMLGVCTIALPYAPRSGEMSSTTIQMIFGLLSTTEISVFEAYAMEAKNRNGVKSRSQAGSVLISGNLQLTSQILSILSSTVGTGDISFPSNCRLLETGPLEQGVIWEVASNISVKKNPKPNGSHFWGIAMSSQAKFFSSFLILYIVSLY